MGYLSETTRRRIAAVILVVGIVLAVLAITDSAFFEDPPTESEKVSSTVVGFFGAAGAQEFGDACKHLTAQAQAMLRQAAARALDDADQELRCAAILRTVLRDSFAEVKVRVRSVSISGNRARAEAALKTDGEPSSFRTILLEEEEDGNGWLISDFG